MDKNLSNKLERMGEIKFFLLAVEAHILAAAMHEFGMSSLQLRYPKPGLLSCSERDLLRKHRVLMKAQCELTRKFVDRDNAFQESHRSSDSTQVDSVKEYAHEIMSFGLFLMTQSVKEMDHAFSAVGIMFCQRTNYSVEAFTLLALGLR